MWGEPAWRRGAWHGSVWPVRYCPAILKPPQQLPEPFPGQHFPHHPVDLRPRDPGHLFPPKPVAGSAAPPSRHPRGDASQPRCGSRTRPGLRRFSPSQTPFLYANGSLPRMPGSGYSPEHWTGSSGVRCRPGSVDGPVDFAGLAPAGRSHPLGAETVAAWSLASLGHRNLTPGLLRQLVAALLHGPYRLAAWVCGDESLILRTGPGRLRRPHRKAGRNVQDVAHPQCRQSLPE